MSETRTRNWFTRSWRGEEPAYKVFWFYAVPINLVFYTCGAVAGYASATNPRVLWLVILLAAAYVAFMVWFCVSLWRCAFNVGWTGWAWLSRGWVALILAGAGLHVSRVLQSLAG